jgi:hypothetical protein
LADLPPKPLFYLLLIVFLSGLTGCNLPLKPVASAMAAETPTAEPILPTRTPFTPQASPAVPTPQLVDLTATLWTSEPQAPVLLYHHFIPDTAGKPDDTHMRLSDFRGELQTLYDNGYSLISLQGWLSGDLQLPPGRRPLILTIDDLFFADQIFLNPDGAPSPKSGLGVLWQFYQAHPDFGFAVALFFNLGDKDYANIERGGIFTKGTGWEDSLAQAVVWCIENGALPYNHFYRHPFLDRAPVERILAEARENDLALKALLERAHRPDLYDRLDNILALPYGHWPIDPAGVSALKGYISPQGKPVAGIVEVGGIYSGRYIQPVYSPNFDRWHIPRMVGSAMGMNYLATRRDRFPLTRQISLGTADLNHITLPEDLRVVLAAICRAKTCPDGVYALRGLLFRVQAGEVKILESRE